MANRKFHRKKGPRRAFLKGLAHNLIMKERMETTVTRAKEIRPIVERMVSIAKKQQLSALRMLLSKLPKMSAQKVYHDIAPRFKERHGGYLRIVRTGQVRKRDGVATAIVEFVK